MKETAFSIRVVVCSWRTFRLLFSYVKIAAIWPIILISNVPQCDNRFSVFIIFIEPNHSFFCCKIGDDLSFQVSGVVMPWRLVYIVRLPLKYDGTRAETSFVFRRNGRVHLNRRGRQFSRLLAAEVYASAVVMLDTPCSEVVWGVLATNSIRQFPLHFPSRASPCAITFQLDSTFVSKHHDRVWDGDNKIH